MGADGYNVLRESRKRRLQARRYLRQLDAQLPCHASFVSKRRRATDQGRLSLMQLMAVFSV